MRACVRASLRLHSSAYVRCSGLAWPSAPALQCLDSLSGAGELPRRLVFSCVCTGLVPIAPVVAAVVISLRLLYWWHAVWLDVCVVSSLAACKAPCLGGCFLAPRAVPLACVGRLAFLVRVYL